MSGPDRGNSALGLGKVHHRKSEIVARPRHTEPIDIEMKAGILEIGKSLELGSEQVGPRLGDTVHQNPRPPTPDLGTSICAIGSNQGFAQARALYKMLRHGQGTLRKFGASYRASLREGGEYGRHGSEARRIIQLPCR